MPKYRMYNSLYNQDAGYVNRNGVYVPDNDILWDVRGGSFLSELQEENKKTGLFQHNSISLSYPLGFPILDHQLGAVYVRHLADGNIMRDVHVGVPAGSITIFTGQTSSGKTAAAIQAACGIVEPFGELAGVVHRDGEHSTTPDRVQVLSHWTPAQIKANYTIEQDNNNWESILSEVVQMAQKKEAGGNKYLYNTGHYDIWGHEYVYYVPSVLIIDSLAKFVSKNEATDIINGLMSSGRGAIYTGMFLRNVLEYAGKYNINIFIIVHMDDAMPGANGVPKAKQSTFMPTGKYMSGGHKSRLYTSSIIYFKPLTGKDDIHTEEEEGWNGVPTDAYVIKSRTSKGGFSARLEFVQETGFDTRLTLLEFAKQKNIICGRNPTRYFAAMPDVKFDTRKFVSEMANNPEIEKALFRECRPALMDLIPVVDEGGETVNAAQQSRRLMMQELYGDLQ